MKLDPVEKKIIIDFFELLFTKLEESQSPKPKEVIVPEKEQNRLIPVSKWNEYHPWPSLGGLRHLCLFRHRNRFDKCVRKIGKRLVIDEKAFFEWVSQSHKK